MAQSAIVLTNRGEREEHYGATNVTGGLGIEIQTAFLAGYDSKSILVLSNANNNVPLCDHGESRVSVYLCCIFQVLICSSEDSFLTVCNILLVCRRSERPSQRHRGHVAAGEPPALQQGWEGGIVGGPAALHGLPALAVPARLLPAGQGQLRRLGLQSDGRQEPENIK